MSEVEKAKDVALAELSQMTAMYVEADNDRETLANNRAARQLELERCLIELRAENQTLRDSLELLGKQDRQIRRMLCLAVASMPYMDDGEAADQEIDYLRDSPEYIQRKMQDRNIKKWRELKGKDNE